MKRRLWIVAAVWVVFWSLYPTFGRPHAFRAAIQTGARALGACDPIAEQKARQECWTNAANNLQRSLDAVTLHNEYAGYLPVGIGVGLGVPMSVALAVMMLSRRRRLA